MISVLTCIYAYNYGAVLQAYALQKKINESGHECNFINYQPYYAHNRTEFGYIKNLIWKLYRYEDHKRGKRVFDTFVNTNINLTRIYTSHNDLVQNPPESKVFIVGSDQVWNFNIESGEDPSFLLDFVPNNSIKCSYAASLAMNSITEEQRGFLCKYLKDYKYLSVRENSAIPLIHSAGREDVREVLDPVYLLSKDEWGAFAEPQEDNAYFILFYAFNSNTDIIEYAYQLREKTGLKLYVIGTVINDKKIKSDKFFWDLSPEGFVGLFSNAKYIITNSFHGMSFSIIFNKPFIKFNKNKGGNSRLDDLMRSLQISNNIDETDYTKSNEILKERINNSVLFLNSILSEDF